MPGPTPGVTLTANLQSILGAAEASGASLQITLCGFGASLPSVPGSGVLADAGIPQTIAQVGSTPISVMLYNNTIITPLGITFYCIAVLDSKGNVVQAGNYQFLIDDTFDLSSTAPNVDPTPPGYQGYQTIFFTGVGVSALVIDGTVASTFDITLENDADTVVVVNFAPGTLVKMLIAQDLAGNHALVWPFNVQNPPAINPASSSTTVIAFVARANGYLYPIGPGTWS